MTAVAGKTLQGSEINPVLEDVRKKGAREDGCSPGPLALRRLSNLLQIPQALPPDLPGPDGGPGVVNGVNLAVTHVETDQLIL